MTNNDVSYESDPWYDPDFIRNGLILLKFLQNYHTNIRDLPVKPNFDVVKPKYMKSLLAESANDEGRSFDSLFADVIEIILPGIVHWQSPKFHGFYPVGFSFPSIYANIISDGFGSLSFDWSSCPASTELEMIMVDWIAKEMNLPPKFRFDHEMGGGIIQGTASEALLVVFIAAREKKIREIIEFNPKMSYYDALGQIMCYTTRQAHFAIPKAACLSAVQISYVETYSNLTFNTEQLEQTLIEDLKNGKHPFLVVATMGTTSTCAFDDLPTIGEICERYKVWFHIDAAYAGSMLFCKEYQKIYGMGFEKAHSITFNPHKLMGVCFDCSILWVENARALNHSAQFKAPYLESEFDNATNYIDWEIPMGRRFRALKLYFHIGLLGMNNIRNRIKKVIELGQFMESLITSDSRFSIPYPIQCGLICFTYRNSNVLTKSLYDEINKQDIFLTSTMADHQYLIRFSVGCPKTNQTDMLYAWKLMKKCANEIDQRQNIFI